MPPVASKQAFPFLISRIAPTPSGFLHMGNGFSFVLTWLLVRSSGGTLSLRIDDADTARARPEYINDIFQCLEWLGLDWDKGPQGPDDFSANFSQANRFPEYQQLLEVLQSSGQLYACNCSRSQIRSHSPTGIYNGQCRELHHAFNHKECSWRVKLPVREICFTEAGKGFRCIDLKHAMGDFVVRRKGGVPAYQIASLADDLSAGTNLLVRGEDLLLSSAAQVYLAQLINQLQGQLGFQQHAKGFEKALFLHHPLILDEKGEKLSKSAGSSSLKSLREAGGNPLSVYARVAAYLRLPAESAASLTTLLQACTESGVTQHLFDEEI